MDTAITIILRPGTITVLPLHGYSAHNYSYTLGERPQLFLHTNTALTILKKKRENFHNYS
jgi:hypothetical protein